MLFRSDNPTLIYHEPYASSASELVCELLQFMPKENNITPLEAQALLAGIMLDTRSFALHVGVRTFEAAAWLRSRGAQTADTKLLFNTSKEEYEEWVDEQYDDGRVTAITDNELVVQITDCCKKLDIVL